ncbi:MAG TPA: SMP-30/gluconolactonase/LRE family protein [Jiangellaceae bacterium]
MAPTAAMEIYFDGLLTEPRLDHPEGIAVHPNDGSVWCGGERGQIFRIAEGKIEQVASTDGFCLGIAFSHTGDLYICDLAHAAVLRMDGQTGELARFADGAGELRFVSPNFVLVDAAGRVYVSDNGVPNQPGPGVFRFDPDGSGELWHPGPFNFANGMALSPDGRTLFVVESWARRVVAVPIAGDGTSGTASAVVELPEMIPDGLAFDVHGRLYVACYEPSQILTVDPATGDWAVLARDPDAHMLCHPTNIAFREDRLLAANLGRWHVTSIDVGVAGVPVPPPAS